MGVRGKPFTWLVKRRRIAERSDQRGAREHLIGLKINGPGSDQVGTRWSCCEDLQSSPESVLPACGFLCRGHGPEDEVDIPVRLWERRGG